VGGNAGSFLDADDATGQFNETLLPLIRGVGALFAGQYSVQPEGINDPHQGIQLADQVCKLGNLGRVDLDGVFGRVGVAGHHVDAVVFHQLVELGGSFVQVFGNLGDVLQDDGFNLVNFVLLTDDPKNNVDGKQGVGYSLKAAFHDALGLEAVYFQSLFENRARVVVVAVAACAYCCLCFCH